MLSVNSESSGVEGEGLWSELGGTSSGGFGWQPPAPSLLFVCPANVQESAVVCFPAQDVV